MVSAGKKIEMKKITWCKVFGHKWIPVFVIGWFGNKEVKFIAAECINCKKGLDDLYKTIAKMDDCPVNSYNEKYYD